MLQMANSSMVTHKVPFVSSPPTLFLRPRRSYAGPYARYGWYSRFEIHTLVIPVLSGAMLLVHAGLTESRTSTLPGSVRGCCRMRRGA